MKIQINLASVKVMRSHDYCHFEINLSASIDCPKDSPEWFQQVDALRKNAARLADKAVDQYKISKREAQVQEQELLHLAYRASNAEETPEDQRTPEQKAAIKALSDYRFNQQHYDYQDDWDQ